MDILLDKFHDLAPWILGALLIAAAGCDARSYLIPNRLGVLIVFTFIAYGLTGTDDVDFTGSAAVALAVLVVGAAMFAAELIGGGDVKLMTAIALWAGPGYVLPFLLIMAMAGGILSLGVLLRPRLAALAGRISATANHRVPYGVAIAAGGLFVAGRLAGF
ncbi:MAG TPA: prepilin peptidase [Thermomicrobiales bacterium]|nr:prepilin peptidase [Thermomicrobiales bacterium]